MGYSPLGVFYNQATTEGVTFISFDARLEKREVFWVTGPGQIHPYVEWSCNVQGGQSANTTLLEHHGFNMPTDGFNFYRNNVLIPFMQSQGVTEGTTNIGTVMAESGWPINSNTDLSVQYTLSMGVNSFLQYAPPDGGPYYEPNPEVMAWFPTLKAASQEKGLTTLGVLIDPLYRSRVMSPTSDVTSSQWFPGSDGNVSLSDPSSQLSLADPNNQRFYNRLRDDLAASGVNFAFWDCGTGGWNGEEVLWFNLLKSWKQAGISIACESSCDIASYVTGTNLFDQYQDTNSYSLVRAVTPQAKIVMLDRRETPTNGTYWWTNAMQQGFVPLFDDTQLVTWAKTRGK